VEVKGGFKIEDWTNVLLDEKKHMKNKADVVIFLMNANEKKYYGELKKFITY